MDRKTKESWARRGIIVEDNSCGWSEIQYNNNSRPHSSFGQKIAATFPQLFAKDPIFSGEDHCTLNITLGSVVSFGFVEFTTHADSYLRIMNLIFIFPNHRTQGIARFVMKELYENMVVTLQVKPIELYLSNVFSGYQPVLSNVEELKHLTLQERTVTKGKKKLLEFYKSIGFKSVVIAGSKATWVSSLPSSLPGLVHFTDI